MKVRRSTTLLLIVVMNVLLSLVSAREESWRELRRGSVRSSIKLRTNTGSHNGSCSGGNCNSGTWILPTALGIFFGIGLCYCFYSYLQQRREEEEKAERKARRKKRQEEELKIQTQLFVQE